MIFYQLIKSNDYKKWAKVVKIVEICKRKAKKCCIDAILSN